ncbi:PREDICTED: inositol-tetrakisphosphate 1-kinase-like [Nicrophorus vespilloides]|uniref:Inositol-tetrakisphosphate 1-kinase n=1 Tax=Nicrophorus vespilloides TaxID=110193 RepID=A0ABM1NAP9_NICVS|nr:PREDICTED: inositol-tetrakisphosphate 1-kinase-like [Nicrophorus vespilloides]
MCFNITLLARILINYLYFPFIWKASTVRVDFLLFDISSLFSTSNNRFENTNACLCILHEFGWSFSICIRSYKNTDMSATKRIAYWMSEKKSQKINWEEFKGISAKYGFELFKLDLNRSLQMQGPITVFLHKLTDIIALADQGDSNCSKIIQSVESYISAHDKLIVIDPIDKLRQLLNRYQSYTIIQKTDLHNYGVFTPNFCEITERNTNLIAEKLKAANISYPFICKPQLGHGSKKAHEMLIIFNENSLEDCKAPCVAQNFINHNAVLFKIFIVGEKSYYVERPSLKNFYASDSCSILFDSGAVSKAGAQSNLSILEEAEVSKVPVPDDWVFQKISTTLRKAYGMELLGVDVVIENNSGRYGIIDVNAYPGYDGFPNFFESLFQCISDKVNAVGDKNKITTCDSNKIPNNDSRDTKTTII